MKSIYDLATGEIKRTVMCSDDIIADQADDGEGLATDNTPPEPHLYKIMGGKHVKKTAAEIAADKAKADAHTAKMQSIFDANQAKVLADVRALVAQGKIVDAIMKVKSQ